MSVLKPLLIGCGALLFVGLLVVGGLVAIGLYASSGTDHWTVELVAPSQVAVGQTFDVSVVIVNNGDKPLKVDDIDFADALIQHVSVDLVTPEPSRTSDGMGTRTFVFQRKIEAQSSDAFTFSLTARQPGHMSGDVDVWSNMKLQTQVLDLEVVE